MPKTQIEKRLFPRIAATLPIYISPEFLGETVDLSETGLKFILQKPLLLSKARAKIELSPNEGIDTEFKVIWNKHLVQDGKFTYGACFIRLKEKDIENLRDAVVQSQLNTFVNDITDSHLKQEVEQYFIKDVKKYIAEVVRLSKIANLDSIDKNTVLNLKKANDDIVQNGEKIIQKITQKNIRKKVKQAFRLLIGPWAYKSLIMKRGFEKPRGYPGDYKMLEIIYDKEPFSTGFGRYFDLYFLNNPYAEAVRKRKDRTAELLVDAINNHPASSMNILNLACGSCREIRDVLSSNKLRYKGSINFGLVDHDEEALSFTKQALEIFRKSNIVFSYFQENILKFYDHKAHYEKLLGKQDLIYSIGLVDYFPDRMLKEMISFCLELLVAKGKLLLTIKDKDRDPFAPLPPGWYCDWEFVPRNEQDIIDLVKSSGSNINIKTNLDESGKIVFIEITKN